MPPPLPPSIVAVKDVVERVYNALPPSARQGLLDALLAMATGKPSVAARLAKLSAETLAIQAAGRGGKKPG